jgi:Cft2 family RNA processing exonuclease
MEEDYLIKINFILTVKFILQEQRLLKHSFSGHAGKDELLELVKKVNPKKVICVHEIRKQPLILKTN